MKILFPCSTFYPAQIGGPNNTLLWHTLYLEKANIQPIIITSYKGFAQNKNVPKNQWIVRDFGKIIYFEELSCRLPLKLICNSVRMIRSVDIVHFNSMFSKATFPLIFIVAMFRKPIILSPRGELFEAAVSRKIVKKRIVLFLYSLIKTKILFHATSKEEAKSIAKYFESTKIIIQPNFIIPEYPTIPKSINYNLVFLGRINPIKNIHMLIEGASKSKSFMNSPAKIIIAGEARLDYEIKYLHDLISLISKKNFENKVVFTGHVEGQDKLEILKTAYFLFLLSQSENFGNVVLEALVCGTPVVASKGTPWKILESSKAGYWIDSNVQCIADTIDKIMKLNLNEYQELCKNSINLIKSNFDINSSNNRWGKIYHEMHYGVKSFSDHHSL